MASHPQLGSCAVLYQAKALVIQRESGEGRAGTDARTSGYRGAARMADLARQRPLGMERRATRAI